LSFGFAARPIAKRVDRNHLQFVRQDRFDAAVTVGAIK